MRIETSGIYNDDRFGRALDNLYLADRASLMTEIVMKMIRVVGLDLSRVHNDSTTVKAYGKIPGRTKTGLKLARGKSKDYRPDLKQLVFSLSVSSDGAVPVHYKTYPGNRTDDTTHIETCKESKTFKEGLHSEKKEKKRIWVRKVPDQVSELEYFSLFSGHYITDKAGYRIYWFPSSEKKKNDRLRREHRLEKAERALLNLMLRLNNSK